MADNEGAVVVTLRDIYEELVKLKEAVQGTPARVDDHEIRIRSIERWRYALPVSFASSILTVVLAVFWGGNFHG